LPSPTNFFADDPVDDSQDSPDRLGRRKYASDLATLLERVRGNSESSVLALIGPWGGGKSSILEMTLRNIRERGDWCVAEFNPWAYSDLDAMLLGFFRELVEALPEGKRPGQARESLGGLLRTISPVGKLGGLLGVDLQSTLEGLGDRIAGDVGATAQRRKAAEALREVGQKVLVVMDDLDRLSPSELLLVFKLVRFVGRLPGVYYLLAYDETTLLDVLARTELCGGDEDRAHAYLEKIVQVRLDVPPLLAAQASSLALTGLWSIAESHGVQVGDGDKQRYEAVYRGHLRPRLDTPRAINRYLAQVESLYTVVGEEVDYVDFALLTFIRTFEPRAYAFLIRHREELTVEHARGRVADRDHEAFLHGTGLGTGDVEGTRPVLEALFPALSPDGVGAAAVRALADRKGVGHADYFDRYFGFAVPDDDLSDVTVRQILLDLATMGTTAVQSQLLLDRLVADPGRICRKIGLRRLKGVEQSAALLQLLTLGFLQADDATIAGGPSGRQLIERLAADVLREQPDLLADRIHRIAARDEDVLFATRLAADTSLGVSDAVKASISSSVGRLLSPSQSTGFLDLDRPARDLLFAWRAMDGERSRHWLRENAEQGEWTLVDVVASLITTRILIDGTSVLDDLPIPQIESLLGVDFVLSRLQARLADEDDQRPTRWVDTPETRRKAALVMLRVLAEKRVHVE
jgi:hypothetical protein